MYGNDMIFIDTQMRCGGFVVGMSIEERNRYASQNGFQLSSYREYKKYWKEMEDKNDD